jgi:hypothetical protein
MLELVDTYLELVSIQLGLLRDMAMEAIMCLNIKWYLLMATLLLSMITTQQLSKNMGKGM